jgi:hypothetical protein
LFQVYSPNYELQVCWELCHHEMYVKIFAVTFQKICISHRCHTEICVALKYSEPCRATLLTVHWEQMACGADNYCLLLTYHKQTPIHERHCPPCNIILYRGLQVNYFSSFQMFSPSSMLSHQQKFHAFHIW